MFFRLRSSHMVSALTSRLFFGRGKPAHEWHEVSYLEAAGTRRQFLLALAMVAWIALLDLLVIRTNFSVLYVVPMMLLADVAAPRRAWQLVGLLVLLTYVMFLLKNILNPAEAGISLIDYRLLNRTLV